MFSGVADGGRGAQRGIVDRRDVERHRAGDVVGIDVGPKGIGTIGRAAVVPHLEVKNGAGVLSLLASAAGLNVI